MKMFLIYGNHSFICQVSFKSYIRTILLLRITETNHYLQVVKNKKTKGKDINVERYFGKKFS